VRGTGADLFLVEGEAERVVRLHLTGLDGGVAAVLGAAHALELGAEEELGQLELVDKLVAVPLGGGGKNGGVVQVVVVANVAQYLRATTVHTKYIFI